MIAPGNAFATLENFVGLKSLGINDTSSHHLCRCGHPDEAGELIIRSGKKGVVGYVRKVKDVDKQNPSKSLPTFTVLLKGLCL